MTSAQTPQDNLPEEVVRLAERCQTATGPDRDIDGWIEALIVKPAEPYVVGQGPGRFPAKPIMGVRADVMRDIGGKDGADYIGAPAYTASLDAAMTLVPEGFDWIIGHTNGGLTIHAEVGDREQRFAATPALALCAAALRARVQL